MDETATLDDVRGEFARQFRLVVPVETHVMNAAIEDPLYAHHLFVCRNSPSMQRSMLASAPRHAVNGEATNRSNGELVSKAVRALWRWRTHGFRIVEPETLNRRWSACEKCPHLIDPPKRAVLQLAALVSEDNRVCNMCGCVARNKARVPSETCPDRDPKSPQFTRWGELALTKDILGNEEDKSL